MASPVDMPASQYKDENELIRRNAAAYAQSSDQHH